jgi:cellulose synthase/poly-beta-1,6-N-acetylglucosamine synthase-like glycosyltransferase
MWESLFWGSIALILYTYVGYPVALYLVGRLRPRRHGGSGGERPSVCLFISAFNEEAVIREKIENSLSLNYPSERLHILIASDGSQDRTMSIAREYVEHGVRIYHHAERRGKSAVLNHVVPTLDDDIVVFTDANAMLAPDAIERLVERFEDPSVGCVVGRLRYVNTDTSCAGSGEGLYWVYESWICKLESRLNSLLVGMGALISMRQHLFRELYRDVANDFQIPMDVAVKGYGVVYEPGALVTECVPIEWREEFRRKSRIVLRGLTGFAALHKRIRGFRLWQFVSHKFLRWLVGVFAGVILVSNVALLPTSPFYVAVFAMQVAFYTLAAMGWRHRGGKPSRYQYVPFYFCMVNAAAIVAMLRFVTGRRQAFWDKAESSRLAPARGRTAPEPAPEHQVPADRVDLEAEVVKN